MDWILILLLVTVLLVALLLTGLWIQIALGLIGIIVLLIFSGVSSLGALSSIAWNNSSSFVVTCVPLFILMGEVILRSKISEKFYSSITVWSQKMKGGLLHSNIIACAVFAAICGSSVATAASIGVVAIPEMLKRGYNRKLLFGSLAAGGTLGILIPPSVPMILYGAMVEESVGKLFIAGIIPGILLALLFMLFIWIIVLCKPNLSPREEEYISWKRRLSSLSGILPMALLILLVMGSIWLGYATPTEAAAMGALASIVLSVLQHQFSLSMLQDALVSTVKTTSMLLFIIVGAQIISYALVKTDVTREVTKWAVGLGLSKWWFFTIIVLLYIFLGCIIDSVSMMLLTIPILYPIVIALGFNSIWFGVVLVIMIELGQVTPPVGLTMFVIHGIAKDSKMSDVVIGSLPFAVIMLILVVIISFFPDIVIWLPSKMIGGK